MDAEGGDGTVAGGRARGRGGGGTGEVKEGEMLRQRMPTPAVPGYFILASYFLSVGFSFPPCNFLPRPRPLSFPESVLSSTFCPDICPPSLSFLPFVSLSLLSS